jgi:excinuclease ABC subunit C
MSRRFKHTEWESPDLIVIDGGKTHLKTAQSLFKSLHITIPVVSVVKDNKHKAREILGDETNAKRHKKEIIILNSEAHRFAIEFYRKKHWKSVFKK